MEFFPRKKKNPPAVIIVALIDVLIVVLIFLLVTTTFKQQPALKLTLPESSQAKTDGSSELTPVFVTVDKEGKVYLGSKGTPITMDILERELRTLALANPNVRIALDFDKEGTFEVFIAVTDAIRAAGVKGNLTINTQKKEKEKP